MTIGVHFQEILSDPPRYNAHTYDRELLFHESGLFVNYTKIHIHKHRSPMQFIIPIREIL